MDHYYVLFFCSLSLLGLDYFGFWNNFIIKYFGSDLCTHFCWIPYFLINLTFYTFGLFLTHFDLKASKSEDNEIKKYKIQPGTNNPLSFKRFLELISLVSFNQLIIGGITQYLFYKFHVKFHNLTEKDIFTIPSIFQVLLEWIIFTVIEEIWFFYSHWALHT